MGSRSHRWISSDFDHRPCVGFPIEHLYHCVPVLTLVFHKSKYFCNPIRSSWGCIVHQHSCIPRLWSSFSAFPSFLSRRIHWPSDLFSFAVRLGGRPLQDLSSIKPYSLILAILYLTVPTGFFVTPAILLEDRWPLFQECECYEESWYSQLYIYALLHLLERSRKSSQEAYTNMLSKSLLMLRSQIYAPYCILIIVIL
jgi:hypothetical protein